MTEPQTKLQKLMLVELLMERCHLARDWPLEKRIAFLVEHLRGPQEPFDRLELHAGQLLTACERQLDAALE